MEKKQPKIIDLGVIQRIESLYIYVAAGLTADELLFKIKRNPTTIVNVNDRSNVEAVVKISGNNFDKIYEISFPLRVMNLDIRFNGHVVKSFNKDPLRKITFDAPVIGDRAAEITIIYRVDPSQFEGAKVRLDDVACMEYGLVMPLVGYGFVPAEAKRQEATLEEIKSQLLSAQAY